MDQTTTPTPVPAPAPAPTAAVLPGVIDLLKESLSFYKKNHKILISIGLVVVVAGIIEQFLRLPSDGPGFLVVISVIFAIAAGILQVLMQIGFIRTIQEEEKGVTRKLSDVYEDSLKHFLPYLWVSILTGLVVVGASLFLLIPGIILSIFLLMVSFAVVVDGKKGLNALTASFYYVGDKWGSVLWRYVGLALIAFVIGFGLGIIVGIITGLASIPSDVVTIPGIIINAIGTFLYVCIFIPIGIHYTYLVYKYLKALRPEPNLNDPKNKSKRVWFIVLAIIGFLVLVALLITVLLFFSVMAAGLVSPDKALMTSSALDSLTTFAF